MSMNWSQGGPPPPPQHQNSQRPELPERRNTNPPPVCFNCGGPHFLVACTQQNRAAPAGFAPSAPPRQQFPPPPVSNQPYQNAPQYQNGPPPQQYGPPVGQSPYGQPSQQPYNATQPPPSPYGQPPYQAQPYNQYTQPPAPPSYAPPPPPPPPQQYGPPQISPYQAPPTPYQTNQYALQPPVYGQAYQQPAAPYQPPPPQWNRTPQPVQPSFSPPPRPPPPARSGSSFSREHPGASNQHSRQQQRQQRKSSTPHSSNNSMKIQTPRKPSRTPSQASASAKSNDEQPAPQNKPESLSSAVPSEPQTASSGETRREGQGSSVSTTANRQASAFLVENENELLQTEETSQDPHDDVEDFEWDFKAIFAEPSKIETVALAQPLGVSFDTTPVPLVDSSWTVEVPSVSRYARKENEREFVRTIRAAPNWLYLQEDPAFAENDLSGPLIPLHDLPAWIAERQGLTLEPEPEPEPEQEIRETSEGKKRSRSEGSDGSQSARQDEVDNQTQPEGRPAKRPKNDPLDDDSDEIMLSPSPGAMPPLISNPRGGTPCLANIDDAWAPQPGEGAEPVPSPADPTEALLASLGVSGSPKPVKPQSLPPYVPSPEDENQLTQKGFKSLPPPPAPTMANPLPQKPHTVLQPNSTASNGIQGQFRRPAPESGMDGHSSHKGGLQQEAHTQPNNSYNTLQGQRSYPPQPYPPQTNPLYQSGPPLNTYNQPQYSPSAAVTYPHVPAGASQNPQYGPLAASYPGPPSNFQPGAGSGQYGPPQNPPWGTTAPYNAPQAYGQSQYGPPPASYGPPANSPYMNAQYPPPPPGPNPQQQAPSPTNYQQPGLQYAQPPTPQYRGPLMPPQQAPGPQSSPAQYGPPQNAYGPNPYPAPAPQYSEQASHTQINNSAHGQFPISQPPQPAYGNAPNGHPPHRQDSGYGSARGSYSNGSGQNGYNGQDASVKDSQQLRNDYQARTTRQQQPANTPQPQPNGDQDERNKQQWGPPDPKTQAQRELSQNASRTIADRAEEATGDSNSSNDDNMHTAGSTPLSPTSAEILGKLVRTSSNSESGSRKVRRPQPVVDAAYSRRW